MRLPKLLIRNIFRKCGYEVLSASTFQKLAGRQRHIEERFLSRIVDSRPDVVFDVGANSGQYALLLRKIGFRGRIVSFEPLREVFESLAEHAKKDDNWHVYNYALGAAVGELEINVSKNLVSSSFLEVLQQSLETEPMIGYVSRQKARIETLDAIYPDLVGRGQTAFLKLDVQGYEPEVLRGADKVLSTIIGLQIEMSVIPIYKNEMLIHQMVGFLKDKGFELHDLQEAYRDPSNRRLLQVDGLFFRET